jgi:predicted protein tyrosine phosphatase
VRALTPLRSKIRRRNGAVVHNSGRLVASSVFDAALCPRSISHNPHADEHDPSACGGQLLIVRSKMSKDTWPKEKNWKKVYTRSEKVHRAKQLGFEYPVITQQKLLSKESIRILFVCSKNQWRSPTAEKIYNENPLIEARSAGTSSNAKHVITPEDIQWSDIIFVMEDKHKSQLLAQYPGHMKYKSLVVLDIEDNYRFMDPELVREIRLAVDPILFAREST